MTDYQKTEIKRLRGSGHGYKEIASALSISLDSVKSFCRRNGLTGERALKLTVRDGCCPLCGKALEGKAKTKPRRFCSDECRIKWWNTHPDEVRHKAVYSFVCAGCGQNFSVYGNQHRKYCSHECYVKTRFGGGGEE